MENVQCRQSTHYIDPAIVCRRRAGSILKVSVAVRIAFPARSVDAFRAERIVCVIKTNNKRYKAFQIAWGGDGSLYVTFPYFPHREGILTSFMLPGDGRQHTVLNLEEGGKVASHLVKYSHHPSGQANFSQTAQSPHRDQASVRSAESTQWPHLRASDSGN